MPDDKVIPVRVALRCRPLIAKEEGEGCQCCLQFVPGEQQVILGQGKAFTYDNVYSLDSPQHVVYENSVQSLVKGLFKGYNATVLAYGQTGSGKTYTMGGGYGVCADPNDELNGVIPRVIRDLYKGIQEREEEHEFSVRVSYIELYKEDLIDLLSPPSKTDREGVQIREENGGIKLVGLTEVSVNNEQDTIGCLEMGAKSRTTGATAMNAHSSRSHAIFTIYMMRKSKKDENDMCTAKFHLVDLAGSERAKKTQAEGERFKEGVNINMGLLALGNVISALGEETQKRSHIPYRDSKLTRLLQDSLGGNSHTLMVACVSPADSNMEETLSTLRYADRARKIKNKPVVNVDPQSAEIMKLKKTVQDLQLQMIQGGKPFNHINTSCSTLSSDSSQDFRTLKDRNTQLEGEKKDVTRDLNSQIAQNALLMEQNIILDIKNEKLTHTLDIVKHKTGMSVSRLETTQHINLDGDTEEETQHNPYNLLKELHLKIQEVEREDTLALSTILEEGETRIKATTATTSPSSSPDTSYNEDEQNHKQAEFQRRLVHLNSQLQQKESVVKQMMQNDEAMETMRTKYETDKDSMVKQIEKLNTEREDLVHELENAKHNAASSKIAEQRRKRLKELEEELLKAKKTLRDQARVMKMKEQSDHQLKKMTDDIKDMKQKRVKLVKQMREENENFRKWKQEKDKEVLQLKAKDRKRQIEMVKMKRTNEQQQAVLRRKAEEASAANKRLKDALVRQKAGQDDRNKKQEASDMSGIGNRVRKWLNHELEVLISIEEVKRHLEEQKKDRGQLVREKKRLLDRLEQRPSPAKRRKSNVSEDASEDEAAAEEMVQLQHDIDQRCAQISDLQEKLMDAGQDDKSKSRWAHIHNMVEAKCAMKHLLQEAVNARLDEGKQKSLYLDSKEQCSDTDKTVTKLKKEGKKSAEKHEAEVLTLRQEYENKVMYYLNELKDSSKNMLNNTQDEKLKERLHFQEREIDRLNALDEQLQKKSSECDNLRHELTRANYKLSRGLGSSLMPDISTDDLPADILQKAGTSESSMFFSPALMHKKTKTTLKQPLDMSEDEEDLSSDDSSKDNSDPEWKSGFTPGNVDQKAKRKIQPILSGSGSDFTSPSTNNFRKPRKRISILKFRRMSQSQTLTFRQFSASDTDLDSPPVLSDINHCTCKGQCVRCPCNKANQPCSSKCSCTERRCKNRNTGPITILEEDEEGETTADVTADVTTDVTADGKDKSSDTSSQTQNAFNTTFNITNSTLEPNLIEPVLKRSNILRKTSTGKMREFPETVSKENGDPLSGGLKKKRKLQSAKYFSGVLPKIN